MKKVVVLFIKNWIVSERLLLIFGVLLLVILWSATLWQIDRDRKFTLDTVMRDGDKFSRAFEEHVRQVLKTNDQYITFIKTEYEEEYKVTSSLNRLLVQVVQDPLLINLAVVDANGKAVASLFPYPADITFSQLPHFTVHTTAETGRLFIGEPFVGRVSNKPSIPLSRRLDHPNGSFAGIVYITLDPEYFNKFYRNMDFNNHYIVRVVGLDGVVRASNQVDELGMNLVKSVLFTEIEKKISGFYHELGQVTGKPVLMNYRVMSDYPLIVQVGVMEEALYPLQQRRFFYVSGAGIISILIVFFTGKLIRRARKQYNVQQQLRLSEEKYAKAFQVSPDSININRFSDGLFLDINEGFTRMTGFTKRDVIGKTSLELNVWVDPEDRLKLLNELMQHGEAINLELYFRRKDGTILCGLMSAKFIVMQGEDCILTIVRDITERKNIENDLYKSNQDLEASYEELTAIEEELRQQFDEVQKNWEIIDEKDKMLWALFHNMHDAFALHEVICDEQGKVIDYRFLAVNPVYVGLVGYSEEQLVGHTVLEVMPKTEAYWIERFGDVAMTGHAQSFENYAQELQCYYHVTAYSPQQGKFAVLVMDITEQKNHAKKVKHLAYHDALTGLPNRLQQHENMKKALEHATLTQEPFAILFLDLNDFKQINDSLGHAAGDEFLKEVATRLQNCLGEKDTIARMGGDEFAVIVHDAQQLQAMIERVFSSIKEPWIFEGTEFHVGTSIGVARYPQDGMDAYALLKCADMAMYRAKSIGDNEVYFYTAALQAEVLERITVENALHLALERNEFVLHYQPQVDITGKIIGVEALLRWQHPTRGMVYPDEFIDIAEKTGLMIAIGEWVLYTACAQTVAWQAEGYPPIMMAVNISATQFQGKGFIEMVAGVLKQTGLSPEYLELEITETVAMTNAERTNEITNALQAMGIRQALDDFGTGYSSLKYLKTFNLDTLKIDKSFIQDVMSDGDSDAIVKAIIALSHNLKLEIIAEGVETKEQWDYLDKLDCQKMQGYYFSRPVAPQDIEALFVSEAHK